ncbi:MAG TPA: ABC transporter permease [Pseudonocardia sp.]|nr:ABC transporter permease [Pseudonocardia sp.]
MTTTETRDTTVSSATTTTTASTGATGTTATAPARPAAPAAGRTTRAEVVLARRPLVGWAVRDSLTTAWRSLVGALRTPQILLFALVQPVMFVLLFRYVFGGAIQVPGGNYVDYLMPGIFVQTAIFAGVATGVGLADDLGKGVIDRFRTLPMARTAVIAGRTVADAARTVVTLLVMLAVGLAVGYRPDSVLGVVAGLGVVLLLSYAVTWFYVVVALLVRNTEAAQSAGFVLTFPLTFASSAFVTTATMPDWLRGFAENQPVTLAADAVRSLTGIGDAAVWPAPAWAAGLLLVLVPASVALFRRAR